MAVPIVLSAGDWSAGLEPELGGAILWLRRGIEEILRPTEPGTADILATACFPLVPYANRIAHGRFTFAGTPVAVPLNFGEHPHSLHGVGWKASWALAFADGGRATLEHRHHADPCWPWDYVCRQYLALDCHGLQIRLVLKNLDGRPMPAGLGLHPYFVTRPDDRLDFSAAEMWMADEDQLPTRSGPPDALMDWKSAGVRSTRPIDNCFGGWGGIVTLSCPERGIRLRASGARFLHIHLPPAAAFIGVEPVSHMPDAVNRPEPSRRTGLLVIGSGEEMAIDMRIDMLPPEMAA